MRANIGLLQAEARALALPGRGKQAAAVMIFLRKNWPDPGLATAECLRIQSSLAAAQIAAGQPEAARATARGVLALLEHEQATSGRTFVSAHEQDALASARLGDTREAALALEAADRVQPVPPFPSDVAHAESLLSRAETLKAIGRDADAAQAARDALALLKAQRADSPRRARGPRARRTLGDVAPRRARADSRRDDNERNGWPRCWKRSAASTAWARTRPDWCPTAA